MIGGEVMKYEPKITPVRYYCDPKYPTRKDVSNSPAILCAVPRRWRAKPAVCMALLFTISTGLYGCSDGNRVGGDPSAAASTSGLQTVPLAIPIFEHGSGYGSYGCVSVAPPVFLSEEEALQVIREEAKTQGVQFSGTKIIEGDEFPATTIMYGQDPGNSTWSGMFELDGFDAVLNIGCEFVSKVDVVSWEQNDEEMYSSVEEYDMKGTAGRLAEVVENTAVFYDPGQDYETFDFDWDAPDGDFEAYAKAYETSQKERMLDDLREQVRDFLTWLAAEGII
jgi:hypothetical protein